MDYEDKRETLINLMIDIEYERSVDFIIYKPDEWNKFAAIHMTSGK